MVPSPIPAHYFSSIGTLCIHSLCAKSTASHLLNQQIQLSVTIFYKNICDLLTIFAAETDIKFYLSYRYSQRDGRSFHHQSSKNIFFFFPWHMHSRENVWLIPLGNCNYSLWNTLFSSLFFSPLSLNLRDFTCSFFTCTGLSFFSWLIGKLAC